MDLYSVLYFFNSDDAFPVFILWLKAVLLHKTQCSVYFGCLDVLTALTIVEIELS